MIVITENQKNELIQHVANFVGMASIRLPDDVMARLQEMRDNETKPSAITLYDIMIGNQKRAVEVKRPMSGHRHSSPLCPRRRLQPLP